VVADALSRHPVDYTPPCFLLQGTLLSGWKPLGSTFPSLVLCALGRTRAGPRQSSVPRGGDSWRDKFAQGYTLDTYFQNPDNTVNMTEYDGFYLHDGKIVVPDALDLRAHLVQELHDSPYAGHLGVVKTRKLIARHYWWPTLAQDVERYVVHCSHCQKNKARNSRPAGLLQPLELPLSPWHTVSMDFITQLPRSKAGHDAIFVIVDKLSKMCHFVATTTTATAEQTARLFINHVWKLHGVPKVIISDRDPLFTSAFTRALCKSIGTEQALSTAYHPQTDGQTERVNRVLEDMLRMYVSRSQTDWEDKLACAEFAVNNSEHVSTGVSPFFLNYGHHPYLPVSLLPNHRVPGATAFAQKMQRLIAEARRVHRIATQRQAQYANSKRRDVQFEEGDWVLLSSKNLRFKQGSPKLLPRWVGPFQVAKRVGTQAYELILPARWKIHDVFHVSVLERYRTDGSVQPPPPADLLGDEVEYEVERILDHRRTKGRGPNPYEYLVKWTGQSHEHNTWEPHVNLVNAPEVLKSYWNSVQVGKIPKKRVCFHPDTAK
jgi:transposase InsO family protein